MISVPFRRIISKTTNILQINPFKVVKELLVSKDTPKSEVHNIN